MSMTTEELKIIVNAFFSDTSRSPLETLEGLEEVQEDIETMIEGLRSDLE